MNIAEEPDFAGVSLDTTTIPQDRLNIVNKARSNLFPWNGQFTPQLIETLLQSYAPAGSFVLDPFVGSGTVLYEAGRLGHAAFGSEVNPAAFKMAEVYRFINVDLSTRKKLVDEVDDLIHGSLPTENSLFSVGKQRTDVSLQRTLSKTACIAEAPLAKTLLEALVVLLNYDDSPLESRGVLRMWKKLRNTALCLPFSNSAIDLANCDARTLPLAEGSVDFVVTSPPYINVFNYHQHYRRSVESLGWDLLEVARSEIGSNRKHRQNRFLTVTQYCLDMASMFGELRRVCSPHAHVSIVVGRESNVRKTNFFNGELVARLAVRSCGYELESRQERVFQNRFGAMIYEDILHFKFRSEPGSTPPTEVARQTLAEAMNRAPAESIADLKDALDRIGDIEPSPIYRDSMTNRHFRKQREAV